MKPYKQKTIDDMSLLPLDDPAAGPAGLLDDRTGLQASPSHQTGRTLPSTTTTTGTLTMGEREQLLDVSETHYESLFQPHSSPTNEHLLPSDPFVPHQLLLPY